MAITLHDLPADTLLDRKAMAAVRGGGAGWLYGWIQAFVDPSALARPAVNLFQFNNYGGQMNNQFQVIDVKNFASNAVFNIHPEQAGINYVGITPV